MSLKNLPKSLVDSVIDIATQSEAAHQKLTSKFFAEGLLRFGVKRSSQLSEADQKALYAWVQIKLEEATCGCESDMPTEDHMPGDEVLYNKSGKMKKQMDEDELADKDHDGDGEVESSSDEYLDSRDKAIKAAMKNEEDSEEVSEEDETDLKESVAQFSDEIATNGAVGVTDPSTQTPVNVDVLRDSDPASGTHEYRLFVQFNTNGLPTIIPSPVLPGAPTLEALREIVEGLPYYGEMVERALQAATPDVTSESRKSLKEAKGSATVVLVGFFFAKSGNEDKKLKDGASLIVKSAQDLSRAVNISLKDLFLSDDDEKIFNDAVTKSSTVYAYMDPWHYEINNHRTIGFAKTEKMAEKQYTDSADSV